MLGQVLTPSGIANQMAHLLLYDRPNEPVRVLDPCVGPGTFPDAIMPFLGRDDEVAAIDVDPAMVRLARRSGYGARYACRSVDYLLTDLRHFDYLIMNPPYLRQEWVDSKGVYQASIAKHLGQAPPGTSNLYVYFLLKGALDIREGGRMVALVYDSWQSTRYGQWLVEKLSSLGALSTVDVGLQPFEGRLIDATILVFDKGEKAERGVLRSLVARGGFLAPEDGCALMDALFHTSRGLRLKQADFFMCETSPDMLRLGAMPFIKKVARAAGPHHVSRSHPEAALVVTRQYCPAPIAAELGRRLRAAREAPEKNQSILTWYRDRPEGWMFHRAPPTAPLLFNYYVRGRPRHLLSPQLPYADNFYGGLPRNDVPATAWLAVLNSTCVAAELLSRARNQGNGLAKLQLFEYRAAYIPDLSRAGKVEVARLAALGKALAAVARERVGGLYRAIDLALYEILGSPKLEPSALAREYESVGRRSRRPRPADL